MKRKKLLISDVDFTLLGDDVSLEQFADWYDQNKSDIQLVLTSGRFIDSVIESIQTTLLPEPDVIIGGVGTELQKYPSGCPIPTWHDYRTEGWDGSRVRSVLSKIDRLEPQADQYQSDFKISYFFRNASSDDLAAIIDVLQAESISAELVYSSQRDLDVLPKGCNKGSAAIFLADHLGYDPQDVIVCGDSANDFAMFHCGFGGIVVGNAHAELLALDGPLVYQSPNHFAAGVLDGLDHWLQRGSQRSGIHRESPHFNSSAPSES